MGALVPYLTVTVITGAMPVTRAEVKLFLRIDHDAEDAFLDLLIRAAVEYVQAHPRCDRALVEQSLTLTFDAFPDEIALPRPPLLSIRYVGYRLADDTWAAYEDYRVCYLRDQAVMVPASGSWPPTQPGQENVRIEYDAGPADPATCSAGHKLAILQLVNHWYRNREPVGVVGEAVELTVESLLSSQWHGAMT